MERRSAFLNGANRMVVALQRIGLVFGPMQVLEVRGRKSGVLRTAPVAVVTVAGEQYVFQAYPKAAWVANVRAADTMTLSRGRRTSTVRLVELPVEDRRPILRELTATVRGTGKRFADNGLSASPAPDAVAAAADRIAVFRVVAA